jgi:hypothetical protein
MDSSVSLDNMLRAILGTANQDQNQVLPPNIYSSMYNTVTSLLISALVKQYPSNPVVLDMLRPFVKVAYIAIKDGFIELPDDYRDILGSPSIVAAKNNSGECGCDKDEIQEPDITTQQQFEIAIQKSRCLTRPITIVPQSEFDYLTTSTYKPPTYIDPVGYMYGANKIKVCPFDLQKVKLQYVRQESQYVYGYTVQPDDTYILNIASTIESEWTSAAFQPIYNALNALYAAYSKDENLRDFSSILHQTGIL